ncbi:MAG: ABC transporter ATP-binding protein [Methylococcales bacterium]|nr:ABC transporter ATP-binding protein [Methylococcales bacterium]
MQNLIKLNHVYKSYTQGQLTTPVLQNISLNINTGEFVAITGPSGNGKSTLLNLLTGIDRPCSGEIIINETALQLLKEEELSVWRGLNVGIVFQFFQLLPSLTLLQNIQLPMDFVNKYPKRERLDRAHYLLDRVGLTKQGKQLPGQVSGGQQQRAAIARALANDPALLVADEPTGNLDSSTAENIYTLFTALQQEGKTLVIVTHNEDLAKTASRHITLHDGHVSSDQCLSKPI